MAQLIISSGISPIQAGSLEAGIILDTSGRGFSNSDHLKLFFCDSSFDKMKYSLATVSLYPNGDMLAGKNSHHSQVFFMCSMIFGTRASYSSLVYCLFKMQYSAFCMPLQANRLLE
jgi:hypothetical protein